MLPKLPGKKLVDTAKDKAYEYFAKQANASQESLNKLEKELIELFFERKKVLVKYIEYLENEIEKFKQLYERDLPNDSLKLKGEIGSLCSELLKQKTALRDIENGQLSGLLEKSESLNLMLEQYKESKDHVSREYITNNNIPDIQELLRAESVRALFGETMIQKIEEEFLSVANEFNGIKVGRRPSGIMYETFKNTHYIISNKLGKNDEELKKAKEEMQKFQDFKEKALDGGGAKSQPRIGDINNQLDKQKKEIDGLEKEHIKLLSLYDEVRNFPDDYAAYSKKQKKLQELQEKFKEGEYGKRQKDDDITGYIKILSEKAKANKQVIDSVSKRRAGKSIKAANKQQDLEVKEVQSKAEGSCKRMLDGLNEFIRHLSKLYL